jgi:hypothetical protein
LLAEVSEVVYGDTSRDDDLLLFIGQADVKSDQWRCQEPEEG